MAQTPEGVIKRRQTMINKHGSYEAYLAYMRNIAKSGGANSSGYDFAHGNFDPTVASKKGWEKRRREPTSK